ncbi:hypothetical protein ACFL2H_03690 [Planctomycetota bacterium]
MKHEKTHLGICSSCKTGPLLVRMCGGCGLPCVLCDECDAMWGGPDVDVPPDFPDQPDVPCPHCGSSLWSEESSWAGVEQLKEIGWDGAIVVEDAQAVEQIEETDRGCLPDGESTPIDPKKGEGN